MTIFKPLFLIILTTLHVEEVYKCLEDAFDLLDQGLIGEDAQNTVV